MKNKMQFNLNDYPHSVLDENSIAVLTWVEKLGLATCAELSVEMGIEELVIGNVVSKLLENQLLQFYNGFVQPSEKGKHVIDKFETFHKIIAHTFLFEEMLPAENAAIRDILKLYRQDYYTNYLFTLNSLKFWRRMCEEKNMVLDCGNNWKEFLLAIFIYDLKRISQGKDALNEKPLYFSLSYNSSALSEMSLVSKAVLHLNSFNALMSSSDFRKFPAPMKDFYEYLYCKDYFFADKIQSRLIDALGARKSINISHIFYSYFNIWKIDFLGGSNKDDRLNQITTSSLQKETDEKDSMIIDSSRMVIKLNTSLSEAELALMVRLYIDAGIITNTSLKDVMEFITKFLNTKDPDSINPPGFKVKYDRIDVATIEKCRYWFKKLLDKLEKHKRAAAPRF